MPTYQYACTECGHRFEAVQTFTESSLSECPECTGQLRKVYGAVGVVFKGSGFYRNDARSDSKAKASAASSSDSSSSDRGSSDKGSGGDTAGKPAAKADSASPSSGSTAAAPSSSKSSSSASSASSATKAAS